MKKCTFYAIGILFLMLISCSTKVEKTSFSIDYEKYTLENGLDVILHTDKSDPIVSVAIQYHVGSNREKPGRTGFAHLFEHMMFQQSENVGQDQFFKKIQAAGGTLNGGTNSDGTVYYEIVPKNALEKALWMESDRMGYLINTVTRSAFANQQNVVQNEKRQMVDNRPYGHNSWVLDKNLYPEGHPYSWQVIGEMENLFNATVKDVKEFHATYYGPNNATLVVAGDIDPEETRTLVEKYFGEIPGGPSMQDLKPVRVTLNETKKLYHEDNFAKTPRFTMAWPTVEQYTKDAYALNFLAELLSSGKKAPMYRVLVKDKKLTSRASAYNRSRELAGSFRVTINANAEISLAEVEDAIFESLALFEEEGITENDMERIKAGLETGFYNSISSVLGKGFQMARYNEYAGSPSFIEEDIANIQAVTIEDVLRVYETYIKDKPYVATSFVPKGSLNLMAENSVKADVVEESISDAIEVSQEETEEEEVIEKTPSSFDRSVEPTPGPDPVVVPPAIWSEKLSNGIKIYGINYNEVPLVSYSLVIKGGHLLDRPELSGTASLVASLMTEGTAGKTPEELEEAIDMLGARINVYGGEQSITIDVNTLSRNFESTVALVEEILLEPRWDEEQFELAKSRAINSIKRNQANPDYLASRTFAKLTFGEDMLLAIPTSGTIETIEAISLEDLKDYYESNFSPSLASLHVVGDIPVSDIKSSFEGIASRWPSKEVVIPEFEIPENPDAPVIYFVDVPGAKQSVIQIGNLASTRTDPDYDAIQTMNYKLGGSFSGFLNLILREEKGFTYGARSSFRGNNLYGSFQASSSVRSNATRESMEIFSEQMKKYREGISQEDLDFTKDALLKSNARQFENMRSLQGMLEEISTYSLPFDYVTRQQEVTRSMSLEQHHELAQKYIQPDRMYYVVVGDAATQLEPLKSLGFGDPVLVER
ncbi:MAG: pitrilysin family protein [Bacteroidales bacterium]|nr:pitrilysin family protein [Bacteroidales bacterium]